MQKKITQILIGLLIAGVVLEVSSFLALLVLGQNSKTFDDIFYSNDNLFVRGDCNYEDSLYPHPYLAFVHNSRCFKLNNIGLLGPDVDPIPKANLVRVGVFGGSVATQFAGMSAPSELGTVLNRCYSDGHKLTYIINNFADGAWKQPQEVIALSLFKSFVDVAVSIEGFNEHYGYDSSLDLAVPANNFESVNPALQKHHFFKSFFTSFYVKPSSPLAHSSFYKLITLSVRRALEAAVSNESSNRKWQLKWYWKLPQEIDKKDWFIQRYTGFVRDFEAIAKANSVQSVIVLQPAPIFKKHWTEQENVAVTEKGYEDSYAAMKKLLSENTANFLDLSAMFADDQGTIFGDAIHFAPDSSGNTRMAEAIAQYMSDRGVIEAKNSCQ